MLNKEEEPAPLQSYEHPEVTPDMSRASSAHPGSDDGSGPAVLQSKRDKRRAKDAKKREDEVRAADAAKLDSKSKGSKHRVNIEDLPTVPATQIPSGKGERGGDKAAPFEFAKNKKSAKKEKQSKREVEVTEADLQRVIDSIEDKCSKLRDRWENERQGMCIKGSRLKYRSDRSRCYCTVSPMPGIGQALLG